jgi:hypothetical protein
MIRTPTGRIVRAISLCLGVLSIACGSGCYERVVGASGFGADSVNVTRPNGPDTKSSKTYSYKKTTVKSLPSPGAPD